METAKGGSTANYYSSPFLFILRLTVLLRRRFLDKAPFTQCGVSCFLFKKPEAYFAR